MVLRDVLAERIFHFSRKGWRVTTETDTTVHTLFGDPIQQVT